jgi:hypothetical protein
MVRLLSALWLLNAFDVAMTWYGVKIGGYAEEANPIMAWALGHGLLVFALLKCVIVGVGCVGIWHLRQKRPLPAFVAASVCTAVYAGIAAWHLYGFHQWRM